MSNVVIVSAKRTAVGSFGGSLKDIAAKDLGALVMREVLLSSGLKPEMPAHAMEDAPDKIKPSELAPVEKEYWSWPESNQSIAIDEIVVGNVLQAGQGQNPGRQAMIRAGIPKETPAYTINIVCGSGLKAIALAAAAIKAGDAEVVLAAGMENMSQVPFALPDARWGYRMAMPYGKINDLMVFDGLYEGFYGYHMGITAENIAESYGISREDQDRLGVESHRRAIEAANKGLFKDEIVPVAIPQKKGDPILFARDERPMETSMEKMGKLATVFKKGGTVTAGNASGINDAAAATLIMTEEKAKALGLKPLARIKGYASGGIDPAYMGLGPIPACRKLFRITGTSVKDYGLVELNEAFASQALACMRELGMDEGIVNVNGSGISIGHPIGATGCRIIVTLIHEMQRRGTPLGLASLCIGGGMGMAMAIELV
ncbi:MAG TPA: acetyl-CoA C-acetyltransferase [Deltaproteobacteria bacterium]|jgi:acetyl-CoA C-acetyltransferase|nr:acetyl-CoA C-acetyltransferase [Deltaproteobacteria bacterium]HOI06798.1 acetyl-CoA C-acetyltransferase [Deltaproteobacteria bacterium]